MNLTEWFKLGLSQSTLDKYEALDEVVPDEIAKAFEAGIIGLREVWLLSGDYKQLKEMPNVEIPLSASIKEDLCIQRLLARPRFRGVVANKPVSILRAFKGVYINSVDEEWEE